MKLASLFLLASLLVPGNAPTPVSPAEALDRLKAGNTRFSTGASQAPRRDADRIKNSANGQSPFAVVLTCADSRLAPELIFDQGVGDLFVLRTAGNTTDEKMLGSMEFAVQVLGARLIVVMGHEKCGAVEAAMGEANLPGNLPAVVAPIKPAVQTAKGKGLHETTLENVRVTARAIRAGSSAISQMEAKGELKIVGANYELGSGKATIFEVAR